MSITVYSLTERQLRRKLSFFENRSQGDACGMVSPPLSPFTGEGAGSTETRERGRVRKCSGCHPRLTLALSLPNAPSSRKKDAPCSGVTYFSSLLEWPSRGTWLRDGTNRGILGTNKGRKEKQGGGGGAHSAERLRCGRLHAIAISRL